MMTGDLGALDSTGRLTVSGRADALILTGGESVHPGVVERQLRSHPGVVDAKVFGVPDPEWGRKVVAEIVIADATIAEVEEWARGRLAPAAVPREWRVVPEMPGKLDP